MIYCKHGQCLADTVAEVLMLADALPTRRNQMMIIARRVVELQEEVKCRRVPRKGAEHAPLPDRTPDGKDS